MKVLVTGGAGDIGRVTARWLAERGWDVRVFDQASQLDLPDVEYISGDITQFAAVREAVRGCDAVVHLAALRNPYVRPAQETFQVNASGTFTVFEAAAAEGIRRIAQASSINAIGCAWSLVDIQPHYFPLDEAHPPFTTDPYSFSKQMVEEIGAYYWRRDGITSVSLRFPWVYPVGYAESEQYLKRRQSNRQVIDEFAAQSEAEQQTRIADIRKRSLEFRAARSMEMPQSRDKHYTEDPLWTLYTFDRFNYWAFVDVRDAAQALEKGLTADYEGHHALFINDSHNSIQYDTQTLIRLFYPEVQPFKTPLSGSASLVSIDSARSLIGFEPAYSPGGKLA